jgi:hypothetical protein
MIAIVLKNFILFLMLLLICHYTIQLHVTDPQVPPKRKARAPLVEKHSDVGTEEEEGATAATAADGMQELYDFVFDDKDAPKNLENMYANQINVTRATGSDPDNLDTFVSHPSGPAPPPDNLYVSSGGFEVVGELEEEHDTGMYLPAVASNGEFSSNLFKI